MGRPLDDPVMDGGLDGAQDVLKSRTEARGFAQRNLEYIQSLAQQKKAARLGEQEERERSQKLQQQLARRVLGQSYDRILSKSMSAPRAPTSSGDQPPCSGDDAVAGSDACTRLPVLVESHGDGCHNGGPAAGDDSPSSIGSSNSSSEVGTPERNGGRGKARRGRAQAAGRGKHTSDMDSPAGHRRTARAAQSMEGKGVPGTGNSPGPKAQTKSTVAAKLQGSGAVDKGSLPPGATMYYAARAQADATAALQRAYAGTSSSYAAYLTWRKQQKLDPGTRVFCISGGGNHSNGIRAGLLARGWWENPDHNSLYFDLKWAIATQDINFEALWPAQVVNHFGKATCITTKVGLCQTLKELAWYEAADQRTFYPRAYDLGSDTDRAAFLSDARHTAAEAIVKRAALDGEVTLSSPPAGGSGPAAARNRRSTEPAGHVGTSSGVSGGLTITTGGTGLAGHRANSGPPPAGPAVDLPSLRLALRVCVARLAHERFLRCEAGGGGEAGPGAAAPAPLELTAAEWAQLATHRCLSTPYVGPEEPHEVDPAWFSRRFITSYTVAKGEKGRRGAAVSGRVARKRRGGRGSAGRRGCDVEAAGSEKDEEEGRGSGSEACESDGEEEEEEEEAGEGEGAARPAGSGMELSGGSVDTVERAPSRDAGIKDQGPGADTGAGAGAASGPGTPLPAGAAAAASNEQAGADAEAAAFNPDDFAVPTGLTIDMQDAQIQALGPQDAIELARKVAEALRVWSVQTHMNGLHNIWIVKPAGKSRGRGIRLFNNLDQLFNYVRGDDALQLEWRWVVQKYVERPLIIRQRKFDIRQWVLVTDWNPLTVYFWNTCYLRFAAEDYDPSNLDIYLHLSNNSIAKYYEVKKDDDITADGNMWSVEQFKCWLGETYGDPGLWESLVQPAMKHIVVCTTKCAQDMVKARKNSCEIYGYDFLIDDQLRVWLLEVNASPTMEASTPITTDLCAEVQEDILKVIVDRSSSKDHSSPLERSDPSDRSTSGKSAQDIGRWECIVDAGDELRKPTYMGLSLELKGSAIKQRGLPRVGAGGSGAGGGQPLVPTCYQTFSQKLVAARSQLEAGGGGGVAVGGSVGQLAAAYMGGGSAGQQHAAAARKARASAPNGLAGLVWRSASPRKGVPAAGPPCASSPAGSPAKSSPQRSKATAQSPMQQRGGLHGGGSSFGRRQVAEAAAAVMGAPMAPHAGGTGPVAGYGGAAGGSVPEGDHQHEQWCPAGDQAVHLPPAPVPTSAGFLRTSSSFARQRSVELPGHDLASGSVPMLPVVSGAVGGDVSSSGAGSGAASSREGRRASCEEPPNRTSNVRTSYPLVRQVALGSGGSAGARASLNGDDLAAIVRGDTPAAAARYHSFASQQEQPSIMGGQGQHLAAAGVAGAQVNAGVVLAAAPRATGTLAYQQSLSIVGSAALGPAHGNLPQLPGTALNELKFAVVNMQGSMGATMPAMRPPRR